MHVSHTRLPTTEGSRLIKRLCTHWAHKLQVSYNSQQGTVDFTDSRCSFYADTDSLSIELHCDERTQTQVMQKVIMEHLQRMAKTDLPAASWIATALPHTHSYPG